MEIRVFSVVYIFIHFLIYLFLISHVVRDKQTSSSCGAEASSQDKSFPESKGLVNIYLTMIYHNILTFLRSCPQSTIWRVCVYARCLQLY